MPYCGASKGPSSSSHPVHKKKHGQENKCTNINVSLLIFSRFEYHGLSKNKPQQFIREMQKGTFPGGLCGVTLCNPWAPVELGLCHSVHGAVCTPRCVYGVVCTAVDEVCKMLLAATLCTGVFQPLPIALLSLPAMWLLF